MNGKGEINTEQLVLIVLFWILLVVFLIIMKSKLGAILGVSS